MSYITDIIVLQAESKSIFVDDKIIENNLVKRLI